MYKDRVTPVMIMLIGLLLLLLVLLGWLQYRWVGQVSESHRERLQDRLQTEALSFGEDFDRELARLYLHFQMDAGTLEDKAWEQFAQRYTYWLTTAPYPQLVKEVFLVEADEAGGLRLSRFNQMTARFEPSVWPLELADWQERFTQHFQQARSDAGSLVRSQPELVAQDIPAVIIPVSDLAMLQKRVKPERNSVSAYTIVRIDRDYLRQQFIPMLARRHFSDGDELNYNLAIISRQEPHEVVYQSDPQFTREQFANGDATVNVFGVQLNSVLNLSMDGASRIENIPGGQGRLPLTSLSINVLRSADKTNASTNASGNDNGQWTLIIKHRAGSLDAAVARLRTQNLLISFGILLLLCVSAAMIMISAQRAQRLASQQIEFVAGVSHELRTPLTVIFSASENLADGLVEETHQVRRYGAVIRSESRRLTEMVEQVMEFAGIKSGQKAYQPRPIKVGKLIDAALVDYETLIAEQGFQIEKQVERDLPLLMADESSLKRAIQNLLNNAMKYSGERRTIKISAAAKATARGAQEVWITVADEGLGIKQSELSHIFEPFYRGREIMAAQIRGNGMGLSLLKHIVKAHGGRVMVESRLGTGSSFKLIFPALTATTDKPLAAATGEEGETHGVDNHGQENFARRR